MKITIVTTLLFLFFIQTFAQKEIYFDTIKTENIKVESLKGLEVSLSGDPVIVSKSLSSHSFYPSFPLHLGYFNEHRIASSWTLISTIGLNNVVGWSPKIKIVNDPIRGEYMAIAEGTQMNYRLDLKLGLEPRWYYNFKERSQLKKVVLNSGCFLSLPIKASTNLLHNPIPIIDTGWFPNYFSAYLSLTPTIGYRQAISEQWFLEATMGVGAIFGFSTYANHFTTNGKMASSIDLKIAYSFK